MARPASQHEDGYRRSSRNSGDCSSKADMYSANASQLTVLGIRISAQCTVEEANHAPCERPLYAEPYPPTALPSNARQSNHYGPPSSFKDPDQRDSVADSTRRRPRSAEFGAKAKEAMMGFGRAARELPRGLYGLRNSSKTDVTSTRDSLDAYSSMDRVAQSYASESAITHVRSILRVRRVYRLRLRSTAEEDPILVGCRTEMRSAHSDGSDTGWERLRSNPVEYIGDREPQEDATSTARAGVFHAYTGNESDNLQSDVESSQDTAYSSGNILTTSDDKRDQALLKVCSPMQIFIEKAGQSRLFHGWRNEVVIRIRFCGVAETSAAFTSTATEASSSPLSPRTTPIGPRLDLPRNHQSESEGGEIVFLSCSSRNDLLRAIESTQLEHGRLTGPLATKASAKLEGIEWVSVTHTSALNPSVPGEFEWTWRDGNAGGRVRPLNSSQYAKCACALVIIDSSSGKLHKSASFQFVIDSSAVQPNDGVIAASPGYLSPDRPPQRRVSSMEKTCSASHSDTSGLGAQNMDRRTGKGSSSNTSTSVAVHDEASSHSSSSTTNQGALRRLKAVNHVGMGLQDVESDSLIFRAAIQGLEKRTTNLKRAAKAVVKAADDLVGSFDVLEGFDGQLDHMLEDLSVLMPASMQLVSSRVLKKARDEERQHRQQTRARLITHVVTPLRALTDVCREVLAQLKMFEAESKVYYSATQKWLSSGSRGNSTSESCRLSTNGSDVYSPDAVRYDKSFAKADKLDDEQRLRQARFDLARFDVYRAVCQLHAGEVELAIASHLMAFSRWYCQDDEVALADLHAFESVADAELERVKLDAEVAEGRCQDLQSKYAEQKLQSKELGSHTSTAGQDDDLDHAQSYPNGKATRQKLKNLLSAIGGRGAQHSTATVPTQKLGSGPSRAIPPVEAFGNGRNSDEAIGDGDDGRHAGISGKLQARTRTVSLNNQAVESERQCRMANDDGYQDRSPDADRVAGSDASLTHASEGTSERLLLPGLATHRRSVTVSDSGLQAEASDTRSSRRPIPIPVLSAREMVQPTRKKEGILWVMAKPISVTGTSDVPKAAVRSNNWRECWVVLSGSGHLGEYAHWKDSKAMTLEPAQPLIDLRFATVREARGLERRFSFEVVTRESRRFFQAPNEEEYRGWMTAISFAIASLLDGTSSVRQVEKVVRHSVAIHGGLTDGHSPDMEFGMRRVFDSNAAPAGIGIHKAFSQSLTDLGAGPGGRLFQRAMVAAGREEGVGARRRDNKTINAPRGHLLARSDGNGSVDRGPLVTIGTKSDDEDESESGAPASLLLSKHARGISNTTPLSGYLAYSGRKDADFDATGMALSSSTSGGVTASRSSLNIDTDYDRQIEALVNSNYGPSSPSGISCDILYRNRSANRTSLQQPIQAVGLRAPSPSTHMSDDGGSRNKDVSPRNSSNAREIMAIASRLENRKCADCRKPDPRWASWCLNGEACCVFICITCSGIHRSMGVGVSKVRSVDLDEWTEAQLQAARQWGNARVNAVYEAKKPRDQTVTSMGDTRTKAFWTAKYVERAWLEEGSAATNVPNGNASNTNGRQGFDAGVSAGDEAFCTPRPQRLSLTHTSIPTSPRAASDSFSMQTSFAYNRHRASAPMPIPRIASGVTSHH